MAAPTKKRAIVQKLADSNEDCVSPSNDDNATQDMLQIDFEGFSPSESDYHGIKILLHQLFLKARIDLGDIADIIISQNHIGSVVKQAVDKQAVDVDMNESDYEDDDDDDNAFNQVFGITTVINITSRQDVPCIKQFTGTLKELANGYATDTANAMIKNVLKNNATHVGLIINERFVNLPAKISVPLIANLITEITRAKNKEMPFNFSHYLLICKLHKPEDADDTSEDADENADEESAILWSNAEEQVFAEEAVANFEFCVDEEADNALVGEWNERDREMIPYRRVLLLEASKLQIVFSRIQSRFS